MENQKLFRPSKKELARMQVIEFGKILFNLQIIMTLIVASPLPFAVYPLYYAGLLLISIFTGFIIFAYPSFVSLWNPRRLYMFLTSLNNSWKITIPIVIGLVLLSILCLSFDKSNKHLKRIITSIVIIVYVIIYLIFRLSIAS